MRQGSNSKRPRNKGGRGASGSRNSLNRSFESNGPGVKVRGNPHQVYEKYLAMARDAQAEDPIMAENLLQHADHYFRLVLDASPPKAKKDDQRRDGDDDAAGADDGDETRHAEAAGRDGGEDGTVPAEAAADADGDARPPKRTRRGRRDQSSDDSEADTAASDAA